MLATGGKSLLKGSTRCRVTVSRGFAAGASCGCAACNPFMSSLIGQSKASVGKEHVVGRFFSGAAGGLVGGDQTNGSLSKAGLKLGHVGGRFYSGGLSVSSSATGDEGGGREMSYGGTRGNSMNSSDNYGSIPELFDQNRAWSQKITQQEPDFFETLSRQQKPRYLWIGCSDSRVPANEVVGLRPGELFVHRNVANVVVHTDLNCLSVIQYAVDALRVQHIIVCGHYGCGGVQAALNRNRLGLVDNWIRHVNDVRSKHAAVVDKCAVADRVDLLCELNVVEQAHNVAATTVVQDAWKRGQSVRVHSWIYGLDNGLLKDLGMSVNRADQLQPTYDGVLEQYNH